MPIFAISLEGLIVFVVILGISALSNWIKQRKGRQADTWPENEEAAPPPLRRDMPPAPPQPTAEPAFDLEKELRRLFGEPEEKPVPPIAPPPVAREAQRPSVPPPLRPLPTAPADREEVFEPVSLPRGTHFPKTTSDLDQQGPPAFDLATMAESSSAYERGSSVDATAMGKLDAARTRTEQHKPALVPARSRAMRPETAAVLAMLKSPRTSRQAVLASFILGPPKALER